MSPICLGIVRDPRTIPAAFEAGLNFFFVTADMHWPYYEATRRGLRMLVHGRPSVRDEVVVAAACYPTQPEFSVMPFQEVVGAVPGLGRVDIAVMGGAYGHEMLARLPVYERHRKTRHAGIRGIGASFHDREAVAPLVNHRVIDLGFVRYNPAHPGAREDLFPRLARPGARSPLFNFTSTDGFVPAARRRALGVPRDVWAPDLTDCYRFALSRREIDGVLCAPGTPRELTALLDALARPPLTDDEQHMLINLARLDSGEATLAGPGD